MDKWVILNDTYDNCIPTCWVWVDVSVAIEVDDDDGDEMLFWLAVVTSSDRLRVNNGFPPTLHFLPVTTAKTNEHSYTRSDPKDPKTWNGTKELVVETLMIKIKIKNGLGRPDRDKFGTGLEFIQSFQKLTIRISRIINSATFQTLIIIVKFAILICAWRVDKQHFLAQFLEHFLGRQGELQLLVVQPVQYEIWLATDAVQTRYQWNVWK